MAVVARIILHAACLTVVLNVVDQALAERYVPLAQLLLNWLRPGHFIVFAVSAASVANRRPAFLLAVLVIGYLFTYQSLHDPLAPAVAVILGLLAARAVLALAAEADPEEEA